MRPLELLDVGGALVIFGDDAPNVALVYDERPTALVWQEEA